MIRRLIILLLIVGCEEDSTSTNSTNCNPNLACDDAITCCDGLMYPTTCCDSNCDEPIEGQGCP